MQLVASVDPPAEWCRGRFFDLWNSISSASAGEGERLWSKLHARYTEPHRHYHTLEHIGFCLEKLDQFTALAPKPVALQIALFYHDAVYEVGDTIQKNKERSVKMAFEFIQKALLPPVLLDEVRILILATRHDRLVTSAASQLIADIDLLGFGLPWGGFLRNHANIRKEYSHVSDQDFRKGSRVVLQRFLDRTPLHYHPAIQARYGKQARENLIRCLNRS